MRMDLKDMDDYDKLMRNHENWKAFAMVGDFLEGEGVLVREKLVDVRLVTLLSSGVIQWHWDKFGEGIKLVREHENFPRYQIEEEYFYNRVKEFGEKHPELKVVSPLLRIVP